MIFTIGVVIFFEIAFGKQSTICCNLSIISYKLATVSLKMLTVSITETSND